MGDTRLVAVISTRIGCGVSDATARFGSRMTGDSATLCTWPPMLSIAVSSGVLAAVVLTDDERVLPYLRDYADQLALARGGAPSVDNRVLQRRRMVATDRTPLEKFTLNVAACDLAIAHFASFSTSSPGGALRSTHSALHKTGRPSSRPPLTNQQC